MLPTVSEPVIAESPFLCPVPLKVNKSPSQYEAVIAWEDVIA